MTLHKPGELPRDDADDELIEMLRRAAAEPAFTQEEIADALRVVSGITPPQATPPPKA